MLRTTPFHSRTAPLCQGHNWRRWSGYVVAGSYELTHEREYWAIRSAAALLDVSPLFKYLVRGPDSARLLDRVVTRNVAGASLGQVMYTPWCDDAGKVVDDGTVTRLEDEVFRLTAADPNLRWLEQNARGLRVTIDDVSDTTVALALQGPAARAILERAVEADVRGLRFFRATHGTARGIPLTVTRTGYTGDLGYELWFDAQHAEVLWDHLVEQGRDYGITPTGILALDIARIEAGLILIDVDYVPARKALIEARKSSPFELGLGWTVAREKAPFVGQEALAAERGRAPEWRLRGLVVDWGALERLYAEFGLPPELPGTAWRTSVPVYAGGEQVGYATSGCWSPVLKQYVALVHLRGAHASPGTRLAMEVTVEHRRKRAEAVVRELPFYSPDRKKA
jgi:aminomethyltransferase